MEEEKIDEEQYKGEGSISSFRVVKSDPNNDQNHDSNSTSNNHNNNGNSATLNNTANRNDDAFLSEDDDESTEHTPQSGEFGLDGGGEGRGGHGRSSKGRHRRRDRQAQEQRIAARETSAVKCLKMTFIILLTMLACVLCVMIYSRNRRNEVSTFKNDFMDRSQMIVDAMVRHFQRQMDAVQSLSMQLATTSTSGTSSSSSSSTTTSWPLVTIPDFDLRADMARKLGGSLAMFLAPIVTNPETRLAWESYTSDHMAWVERAIKRQQVAAETKAEAEAAKSETGTRRHLHHHDRSLYNVGSDDDDDDDDASGTSVHEVLASTPSIEASNLIWRYDDYYPNWTYDDKDDNASGPFFPLWHHTPLAPAMMNYDLGSDTIYRNGLLQCWTTQQVILGQIMELYQTKDFAIPTEETYDSGVVDNDVTLLLDKSSFENIIHTAAKQRSSVSAEAPVSVMYHPVVVLDPQSSTSSSSSGTDTTVVAIVLSMIYWPNYFANILPPDAVGYTCVISNECGQSFTLRLDGPMVSFVGPGDVHGTQYDDMVESYQFQDTVLLDADNATTWHPNTLTSPTSLISETGCSYSIHIYPSQELEDLYITKNPIFLAVGVGLIFFVTVLLFVMYDYLVERRQRMVMKFALESHAIVSSLFPANVRSRMFGATRSSFAFLPGAGGILKRNNNNNKNKSSKKETSERKQVSYAEDVDSSQPHDKGGLRSSSSTREISVGTADSSIRTTTMMTKGGPNSHSTHGDRQPLFVPSKNSRSFSASKNSRSMSGPLPSDDSDHPVASNHKMQNHPNVNCSIDTKMASASSSSNNNTAPHHDVMILESPIADLFPDSTVLFADIAGFTAWSSQREPTQVFTLLQTIYHAFDRVANKRNVFKVETIGGT
jgi:hypothetical protein